MELVGGMQSSALWQSTDPLPVVQQGRPVALLSLFDGVGTARLAIDKISRIEGPRLQLIGSWFAEWHAPLHKAVDALWRRRTAVTGCRRHEAVANDVWDLLRDDGQRLRCLVDLMPC